MKSAPLRSDRVNGETSLESSLELWYSYPLGIKSKVCNSDCGSLEFFLDAINLMYYTFPSQNHKYPRKCLSELSKGVILLSFVGLCLAFITSSTFCFNICIGSSW